MTTRRALSSLEKEVLINMEDHRWVTDPLESAFISGGLSEFRNYVIDYNAGKNKKGGAVKSHERIAILLRGNDNRIILYKNNHKILELSAREIRGKIICSVRFDYNHARYTKDWYKKLKELEGMGFRLGKSENAEYLPKDIMKKLTGNEERIIKVTRNKKHMVIGGEIGTISCSKEIFSHDDVEKCLDTIQGLIKDFFKTQSTDYYRQAVSLMYPYVSKTSGSGANVLVEKRWQQRLLFHFSNMQDGYYSYDLEFSQKYPDKAFVERFAKKHGDKYLVVTADSIKEALGTNEPDMLAIRYENGEPKALVLIEVKSTLSACKSKTSDVKKHMEGMHEYANQKLFMQNRKTDAFETLCQYQRMGVISNKTSIKEIPDNITDIEKVMLFTNANVPQEECIKPKESALDYLKKNWGDVCKWSKKYGCEVWKTEDNYWSDNIDISKIPVD